MSTGLQGDEPQLFLECCLGENIETMSIFGDNMMETVPGLKGALGNYEACFFQV